MEENRYFHMLVRVNGYYLYEEQFVDTLQHFKYMYLFSFLFSVIKESSQVYYRAPGKKSGLLIQEFRNS